MTSAPYPVPLRQTRDSLAYYLRVLRVMAAIEFKIKYADSAMGYLWSLAKPLSYFGVLWVVFRQLFDPGTLPQNFALYLILGVVLHIFFVDTVSMTLPAIATRGSLLRRLAFSPLVIPISVTVTTCITFGVNLLAIAVFIVLADVHAELDWLLLVPLLVELYVFTLGVGLIVTTLFVRFRDIAQLWELAAQLLIFATPVMYPLSLLPSRAQTVAFLNPLVQIMQDVRALILGDQVTASTVLGTGGRLVPIGVALATLALGLILFRRDAPRFAERV